MQQQNQHKYRTKIDFLNLFYNLLNLYVDDVGSKTERFITVTLCSLG